MGITTYLFHKSKSLERQRFNKFFLDMGENIHFHYRDLRIELSVDEFVELAELFSTYAKGVMAEIEAGYKDGVLANTNEVGTLKTFMDKDRPLQHPVKYHERQLAVEETSDGYHLHIRNYKILLFKESFQALVQAIAPVASLLKDAELNRDPFELLVHNELSPRLISRKQWQDGEDIVIEIEKRYRNKGGQVLKALGYKEEKTPSGERKYLKNGSIVLLVLPGMANKMDSTINRSNSPVDLEDFLRQYGGELDAAQLNQLKLKILSLLKMSEKKLIASFRLDNLYVHPQTLHPVVDLFGSEEEIDTAEEISRFSRMLAKYKLFFVKPRKEYLPPGQQAEVQDRFFRFVQEKLARHDCVRKIYVLGSSSGNKLGRYAAPFVHFDWVKLTSDFDIYIELDPDSDSPIPEEWQKQFYWDRAGCDYYHFGEIGNGMNSDIAARYPHVRFYDHLVEGYLYNPETGDRHRRDAWLAEIDPQCIFSRDRLARWIGEHYDISARETEKFDVASFNHVYHVLAGDTQYVLKVYDFKHLTEKNRKKIDYEVGLLSALEGSGLEISYPVKNKDGQYITPKDEVKAVVFNYVPGKYVAKPSGGQVRSAGNLLARVHIEAKAFKTSFTKNYSNKATLHYWLDAWQEYHASGVIGTDVSLDIEALRKAVDSLQAYPTNCHGDLSLINYLFDGTHCHLIDFQSIAYGPALIDLTNGMIEFSARKNEFLTENMENFRRGYEEVRSLTSEEKDNLHSFLLVQAAGRQAKLIRLHYGGFGYELKTERLLGLRKGIFHLLEGTD